VREDKVLLCHFPGPLAAIGVVPTSKGGGKKRGKGRKGMGRGKGGRER